MPDEMKNTLAAREAMFQSQLPAVQAFVRLRAGPRLRSRESCSDLVQSTCREAIAHWDRFEDRGGASFRNWLCKIALNKIRERERSMNTARREVRREVAGDQDETLLKAYATFFTPSQEAILHERVEGIERAFDRLEEEQREVILLARVVGLPHAEIAEKLGRSEVAVRSLLSRALVKLSGLIDA